MNLPIDGLKVVTAEEMARIEKLAYQAGASEQTFMENAGKAIANAALDFIERFQLPKIVTLLVGKGNNGGDAFAAGANLLARGIRTIAIPIYPKETFSPLCKTMYERFSAHGGLIREGNKGQTFAFEPHSVLLDGLVGTGFRGKAEGILAWAIETANQSGCPILAIDIPSGLDGSTGEVASVAIRAKETIFLGLPKSGFFLKEGWDHVGKLRYASFGLDAKYTQEAAGIGSLLNEQAALSSFPPIKRSRHKYEAGYVLAVAGSTGMPGAALLSTFAALRSGAGVVRLFHPRGMQAELSGAPYPLIREEWERKNLKRIHEEARRAKAMLIGPGMGRAKDAKKKVRQLLEEISLPLVLDADALFFLSEHPEWKLPKNAVLTPHHGEMKRLLSSFPTQEKDLFALCQAFAEAKETTIVLKGAPTFLFHPGTSPLIVTRGDPGMATAGAGDVLTGIIAGMLAQGLPPRLAAAVSTFLHGLAGEAAAAALTSYCVTASDLIDALPDAFGVTSS